MALIIEILLGLGFAAAVGGVVHVWRARMETERLDALQALAARRGWALTLTGERLGRAGTLRLAPRGGNPWVAEARPAGAGPGAPATLYEAGAPRWAEGTLVLVARPQGAPEAMRAPGPDRGAVLARQLGADLAGLPASVRPVEAGPGVVALADADPSRRAPLEDLGRLLGAWRPVVRGERGRPVLILSPEGMQVRLGHAIGHAGPMERFVDLCLDLSRTLGPD